MSTLPIRSIVEESLGSWFNQNITILNNATVSLGLSGQARTLPAVIIHCESSNSPADLGAMPLGNFELTIKIYVYSSADDDPSWEVARDKHRLRCVAVEALMADVASIKSNWVQGTLYNVWKVSDDESLDGRRYGNLMSYTAFAVYDEGVQPFSFGN